MAVSQFDEANRLNEAGQYKEALELYDQILTQNWNNAGLMATMGTVFMRDSKTLGLAICLMQHAVEKSETIPPEVMSNLGLAYKYAGQRDKALHWMERAVKKEPTAGTLTNYGSMFVENGDPSKALPMLDRAIKMSPELALAHWNLSVALLESGHWERGWREYEWGSAPGGMRPDRVLGGRPRWNGEPGIVAVSGEQGIGDEIMFASMLPEMMKTNTVIFDCHKRLKTLFERSLGVKCYGTREDAEVPWTEHEPFDYHINIGSLGKFYRNKREDFPGTPYLKAEPLLPKGRRPRVGISWTGGRLAGRIRKRTVPLSWWKSILSNDCEFVSLQYTDQKEEIEIVEKEGYAIVQHPAAQTDDYYETARLVASCDLVITVCTSVVHLAGALGVPCWVMTPKAPAWRYQHTGGMPWYRSVRLYRQAEGKADAWIPVVQRVGLDLADFVDARRVKAA